MLGFKIEVQLARTQKRLSDRWIAAQNGIYHAKCDEEYYFYKFSQSALSLVGLKPKTDAAYSHLASHWMRSVPSQILRNGACRYYEAKQRFFAGVAKHPRKKKGSRRSCRITNELFSFEIKQTGEFYSGVVILKQIGKIRFNLGKRRVSTPKMITLSREGGRYFLSFCYADGKVVPKQRDVYEDLKQGNVKDLKILGNDRGVVVQAACSDGSTYSFSPEEKERLEKKERRRKRFQRKLARQQKGSCNRKKTLEKLSQVSAQISNIKSNFNHHLSKKIANSEAQIVVLEDLKLKNMTASASGTIENPGKNVAAKSGLNRAILNCNLGQQFRFIQYKAIRNGKLVLLVNPKGSSIECRKCAHSDSNNRLEQDQFRCLKCGHTEHADIHAAKVIALRGLHDFMSGNVKFLDGSKKKIKGTRRKRGIACGEDVRQAGLSTNLAASTNQEPESLRPSAIVA